MEQKLIERLSYILLGCPLVFRDFMPLLRVADAFPPTLSCSWIDRIRGQEGIFAEQAGLRTPKAKTVAGAVHQQKRSSIRTLTLPQSLPTFRHHRQKITGGAPQGRLHTYTGSGWTVSSGKTAESHS